MAEALEGCDGKVWRRNLERETLANQPGELGLMLERVDAGDDPAGAVPEQVHGQAGFPRLGQRDHRCNVAHVVGKRLDVEAFTVGPATSAQTQRVPGQAGGGELLAYRLILAAVRVEAVADDHDCARNALWTPRSHEDVESGRP